METLLLLLSFLIMPKDNVIDYQNVEYVAPVMQGDPGIASPRIDARVQTNNRYLDSFDFISTALELSEGENGYIQGILSSNKVGNLQRGYTSSPLKFNITSGGTYLLIGSFDTVFNGFVGEGLMTVEIYKNGVSNLSYQAYVTDLLGINQISGTINLKPGDIVEIKCTNGDISGLGGTVEFIIKLTMLKLS